MIVSHWVCMCVCVQWRENERKVLLERAFFLPWSNTFVSCMQKLILLKYAHEDISLLIYMFLFKAMAGLYRGIKWQFWDCVSIIIYNINRKIYNIYCAFPSFPCSANSGQLSPPPCKPWTNRHVLNSLLPGLWPRAQRDHSKVPSNVK